MHFYITIKVNYRNYRLFVELISKDERNEVYRITGRNKAIELQSNRPFFRNKGLKHRKPDWKLVAGKVEYLGSLNLLIEAIMKVIDQ